MFHSLSLSSLSLSWYLPPSLPPSPLLLSLLLPLLLSLPSFYRHKIESDIWRTFTLTGHTGPSVTISSAIQEWLSARDAGTVVGYTESCRGPRCNPLCPEDIILGELGPVWGYRIQLLVSLSIVAISALSLSVKASLYVWYKVLERRQRRAIESGEVDPNKGLESNVRTVHMQTLIVVTYKHRLIYGVFVHAYTCTMCRQALLYILCLCSTCIPAIFS